MICLTASVFIYRPFCKYICPLGAFYGLFQKLSLIRMRVDEEKCVDCGICAGVCGMGVDPRRTPNSNECIRCRVCIGACPKHAISLRTGTGQQPVQRQDINSNNLRENRKHGYQDNRA